MNDVVQSLLNGLNQTQIQELMTIAAFWLHSPDDWSNNPALPTIPALKLNQLRRAFEPDDSNDRNPLVLQAVIKGCFNAIDDATLDRSIAA